MEVSCGCVAGSGCCRHDEIHLVSRGGVRAMEVPEEKVGPPGDVFD